MTDPEDQRLTLILHALDDGDPRASSKLLPLVYEELRSLARARMARTPPGNTLQPTALVHEAYMRLIASCGRSNRESWDGRGHFFAAAANAMRDILVEQARRKAAIKRGGDRDRRDLDECDIPLQQPVENIIALDEALRELERDDPRKSQVVVLKHFAGLTNEEIAAALDISVPTVERDWRFARAWLQRKLAESTDSDQEDRA